MQDQCHLPHFPAGYFGIPRLPSYDQGATETSLG